MERLLRLRRREEDSPQTRRDRSANDTIPDPPPPPPLLPSLCRANEFRSVPPKHGIRYAYAQDDLDVGGCEEEKGEEGVEVDEGD